MFVRNVLRNREKVLDRKLKKLGVRAIASYDSENIATWAVSRVARATQLALTAARIYFTNDATADKRAVVLCSPHRRFVSDRTFKPSVPARDLEIGVADS